MKRELLNIFCSNKGTLISMKIANSIKLQQRLKNNILFLQKPPTKESPDCYIFKIFFNFE